jgi:RND superfamily putative drug exporter
VPAGIVTPLEVLVRGDDAGRRREQVVQELRLGRRASRSPSPRTTPPGARTAPRVVHVVPEQELVDIQPREVVERIRDRRCRSTGVEGVAGPGATVLDYSEAVFKRFPLVMALIALATFLLLVRAFRSLLLPLKAVLLNVLSVAATFGFVVLFWQRARAPSWSSTSPRPAP